MKYHPDRNSDNPEATTKFQEILKAYTILSDPQKRQVYDQTGLTDDDAMPGNKSYDEWYETWRAMFARISTKDIEAFEKEYVGSELEMEDLKEAYLDSRGDMGKVLDAVPLCTYKDEGRFRGIIEGWIEDGSVPSFAKFVNEDEKKAKRRLKKAMKEEKEAEEYAKELGVIPGDDHSLERAIMAKRQGPTSNKSKHEDQMGDIAAMLAEKYGGGNNDTKKKKKKKKLTAGKENTTELPSEPTEEEFAAARARLSAKR